MRLTNAIAALVLLCAEASAHRHGHRRRAHSHFSRHAQISAKIEQLNVEHAGVEKRGSTCSLPDHSDLQRVPGDKNGGFAMSPDQACEDGMYCPIACKPGMVMAQWKADTNYEYPDSMDGGLYCDGGKAKKPFEDSPYCVDGTGTVKAVNKCGKKLSFCQTVLPGNEAMLIPTVVDDSKTLAVPDPSYWDSTAAHYYINPPGTGDEGCIWGDSSKPIGNWAPYVAGANTDGDGQTFLKLGFNPIFEFEGEGLEKKALEFGVRIECPDGGCNGLPCELNPAKKKFGDVVSDQSASGAGGSSFCVVTVPSGSKADIVVFNTDGSGGDYDEDDKDDDKDKDKDKDDDKDKDEDDEKTTSTPEPSSKPSSSSETPKSTSSSSSSSSRPTVGPGIFREQPDDSDDSETSSATASSSSSPSKSSDSSDASETEDEDEDGPEEDDEPNNAPGRQSNAAIGLVVAVAAAACFY